MLLLVLFIHLLSSKVLLLTLRLHWRYFSHGTGCWTHATVCQVRTEHCHLTLVLWLRIVVIYHCWTRQHHGLRILWILTIHVKRRKLHHPFIFLLIRPVQWIKLRRIVHLLDVHLSYFDCFLDRFDFRPRRDVHFTLPAVLHQAHSVVLDRVFIIVIDPRPISCLFQMRWLFLSWLTASDTCREGCVRDQLGTCSGNVYIMSWTATSGSTLHCLLLWMHSFVALKMVHFIYEVVLVLARCRRHVWIRKRRFILLLLLSADGRFWIPIWLAIVGASVHARLRRNALTTLHIWIPHSFRYLLVRLQHLVQLQLLRILLII